MKIPVFTKCSFYLLLLMLFTGFIQPGFGQELEKINSYDTTQVREEHNPGKALFMSAVLPGAGQVYNKKYWKVPVIYAGFITCGYFISVNNTRYQRYRKAYIQRADGDSTTVDNYVDLYTESNLLELKTYYRRNRDLTIIITAAVYVLNLLDSYVDAHLFYFNVNDNLSLQALPEIGISEPTRPTAGIRLNFTFR